MIFVIIIPSLCSYILKQTPRLHKYVTLIRDINDLLNFHRLASIGHTLREGNSCVDFLTILDVHLR